MEIEKLKNYCQKRQHLSSKLLAYWKNGINLNDERQIWINYIDNGVKYAAEAKAYQTVVHLINLSRDINEIMIELQDKINNLSKLQVQDVYGDILMKSYKDILIFIRNNSQ